MPTMIDNSARPLDLGVHWLAEGPVWDESRRCLAWVDIMAGDIHEWAPDSDVHTVVNCGQPVGAVGLRTAGGWVAALQGGIATVTPEGTVTWLARDILDPGFRFNDAKVDAAGRLWAGSIHLEMGAGKGALYRVDPDGEVRRVCGGLELANGMGWSPAGDTFYLVDSLAAVVYAFDFDADAGIVSSPRPHIRCARAEGMPDGLAIDAEGGLWLARYGAGVVERYDAAGRLSERVTVAAAQPTCPGFGGDDYRTLYVTTGWERMTNPGPAEGRLYACEVSVGGIPPHRFGG